VKIPSNDIERELFYINLAFKCNVTRETRRSDYMVQRSFYLFGSEPEEPPALYNKIYPHVFNDGFYDHASFFGCTSCYLLV